MSDGRLSARLLTLNVVTDDRQALACQHVGLSGRCISVRRPQLRNSSQQTDSTEVHLTISLRTRQLLRKSSAFGPLGQLHIFLLMTDRCRQLPTVGHQQAHGSKGENLLCLPLNARLCGCRASTAVSANGSFGDLLQSAHYVRNLPPPLFTWPLPVSYPPCGCGRGRARSCDAATDHCSAAAPDRSRGGCPFHFEILQSGSTCK